MTLATIARAGLLAAVVAATGCEGRPSQAPALPRGQSAAAQEATTMSEPVTKTDGQWRHELTPEQYRVMRQKGTERPFTGKYWATTTPGVYRCAACGQVLFDSKTKFDAGCGWPSFSRPAATGAVAEAPDNSLGIERTEVVCSRCGAHLGHVFDDGPQPTGLRYCVNSTSLSLQEKAADTATSPAAARPK